MGVHGLSTQLKKNASVFPMVVLGHETPKELLVDGLGFIYHFLSKVGCPEEWVPANILGGDYEWVDRLFRAVVGEFYDAGIHKMIFVFDTLSGGCCDENKLMTRCQRTLQKYENVLNTYKAFYEANVTAGNRMKEALTPSRAVSQAKLTLASMSSGTSVGGGHHVEVRAERGEADWVMTAMLRSNPNCVGILSNDSDFAVVENCRFIPLYSIDIAALLLNTPFVALAPDSAKKPYLGDPNSSLTWKLRARMVEPAQVASVLGLPQRNLADFAVLAGNDYSKPLLLKDNLFMELYHELKASDPRLVMEAAESGAPPPSLRILPRWWLEFVQKLLHLLCLHRGGGEENRQDVVWSHPVLAAELKKRPDFAEAVRYSLLMYGGGEEAGGGGGGVTELERTLEQGVLGMKLPSHYVGLLRTGQDLLSHYTEPLIRDEESMTAVLCRPLRRIVYALMGRATVEEFVRVGATIQARSVTADARFYPLERFLVLGSTSDSGGTVGVAGESVQERVTWVHQAIHEQLPCSGCGGSAGAGGSALQWPEALRLDKVMKEETVVQLPVLALRFLLLNLPDDSRSSSPINHKVLCPVLAVAAASSRREGGGRSQPMSIPIIMARLQQEVEINCSSTATTSFRLTAPQFDALLACIVLLEAVRKSKQSAQYSTSRLYSSFTWGLHPPPLRQAFTFEAFQEALNHIMNLWALCGLSDALPSSGGDAEEVAEWSCTRPLEPRDFLCGAMFHGLRQRFEREEQHDAGGVGEWRQTPHQLEEAFGDALANMRLPGSEIISSSEGRSEGKALAQRFRLLKKSILATPLVPGSAQPTRPPPESLDEDQVAAVRWKLRGISSSSSSGGGGRGMKAPGGARGGKPVPPKSYTCNICKVKGHWIQDCAHYCQPTSASGRYGSGTMRDDVRVGGGPGKGSRRGADWSDQQEGESRGLREESVYRQKGATKKSWRTRSSGWEEE